MKAEKFKHQRGDYECLVEKVASADIVSGLKVQVK